MDEKITHPKTIVPTNTHSLGTKHTKNTKVNPKKFAQINNRFTDLRCHNFSNKPALSFVNLTSVHKNRSSLRNSHRFTSLSRRFSLTFTQIYQLG
jgi:hypothetical protein